MSPREGGKETCKMTKICIGKECTYTRTRKMQTCRMIKICIGKECTYTRTRKMRIHL
ncbi:hypothetical protein HanPI659440_Chr05g0214251 [Helianthus annuus]|nr:hypothetical protein HanPI659440_Chr05g0214251 [Helianthus annuus]